MCKMLMLAVFLLCLLPMMSGTVTGLDNKILLFPGQTDYSYVKITQENPLSLRAFTLCMHVATELQGKRDVILFAYYMPDNYKLNVWIEKGTYIGFYINSYNDGVYFPLPTSPSTFRTHLCFTWSSSTGLTAAWMNGQRSIYQIYRQGQAIIPGGTMLLGQEPQKFVGDFKAEQSFVGEIKDVNLWDEVLTANEIKGLYAHTTAVKVPNVINWRTAEYTLFGIVEVVKDDF